MIRPAKYRDQRELKEYRQVCESLPKQRFIQEVRTPWDLLPIYEAKVSFFRSLDRLSPQIITRLAVRSSQSNNTVIQLWYWPVVTVYC